MIFQVSYAQYVHLKSLQKKVEKLDEVMNHIRAVKTPQELATDPKWRKLATLRKSLVQILPI